MNAEDSPKGEATISFNVGYFSVVVKGTNDEELLTNLLKTSLSAIEKNREKVNSLLQVIPSSGLPLQTRTSDKEMIGNSGSGANIDLKPALEGKIEIIDDYVKLVSPRSFDISNKEAVGVVMYALNRPLKPKEISSILIKGWKKVANVRDALAKPDQLKKYVAKVKDGYILTGEGRRWTEQEVLSKL